MIASHTQFSSVNTALSMLCAITLLIASKAALCDSYYESSSFNDLESVYGNEQGLIPTHMMDDELLFLAAEAARDQSMSGAQKQANFNWLCNYRKSKYLGLSALRKLAHLGFINYRSSLEKQVGSDVEKTTPLSQFANLENYRMDVSDDKLVLGFRYNF